MIEERLAKLEGIVEGFRFFPPLALTALSIVMAAIGVVLTIGIFSLNGMRGEIKDLGVRMDGLSRQLTDEFRAMRAETAAQTSAIANSITAARQFQPQVIVVPPAPEPQQDQRPRR